MRKLPLLLFVLLLITTSRVYASTDTTIRLSIGETTYTINQNNYSASAVPIIQNGRTMVPLCTADELKRKVVGPGVFWVDYQVINYSPFIPVAYIARIFGAQVQWDNYNQAVYLNISSIRFSNGISREIIIPEGE